MLEELMEKMPRYYERMPEELQKVFGDLPLEMRIWPPVGYRGLVQDMASMHAVWLYICRCNLQ